MLTPAEKLCGRRGTVSAEVTVMNSIMRRGTRAVACVLFVLLSVWNVAAADNALEGIERLFGKDWYGLYMLGKKFGHAMTDFGATEFRGEKAYKLRDEVHLEFAMFGTKQELDTVETRIYGADGRLRWLKLDMPQPMGQTMQYLGETVEGKFRVTKKIADEEEVILIDIPNETLRDALEAVAMISENTKVGDSILSETYQPFLNERETLKTKSVVTAVQKTVYNGVLTQVFQVETTILSAALTAVAKVTADGETLEQQFGVFTMRLENEALAKDMQYVVDMMIWGAVSTELPITNPRGVTEMTARIEGITDENLIMNDARQSYSVEEHDGEQEELTAGSESLPPKSYLLTVTKDDLDAIPRATIPMRPEEFGSALKPSSFVQSSNPEIVRLARSIVGSERNAVGVMKKLTLWVYHNLRKGYTASASNALDTLARKSGDCTEHSVLFVALARAAGLPAREVAGVVYSEEGDGFFFHQWAEAYVGKWVSTDPTFGQPIADATHIKLTEGEILKQMRIMNAIGRLKIDVVDFEHD